MNWAGDKNKWSINLTYFSLFIGIDSKLQNSNTWAQYQGRYKVQYVICYCSMRNILKHNVNALFALTIGCMKHHVNFSHWREISKLKQLIKKCHQLYNTPHSQFASQIAHLINLNSKNICFLQTHSQIHAACAISCQILYTSSHKFSSCPLLTFYNGWVGEGPMNLIFHLIVIVFFLFVFQLFSKLVHFYDEFIEES